MGNWEKQQETMKETREKDKLSREVLGKFFYDLAKVTFTAMVVGGAVAWISDSEKDYAWILLLLGVLSTMTLSYAGYKIIKK